MLSALLFVRESRTAAQSSAPQTLPSTTLLERDADRAAETVAGVDQYLSRLLDASVEARARRWNRDASSHAAWHRSTEANRKRLSSMLGIHDERVVFDEVEFLSESVPPAPVARCDGFDIWAVRWNVLKGLTGEGLLLEPKSRPLRAGAILVPDCEQTPEALVGLAPGVAPGSRLACRLAANGCRVVIPTLIDRQRDLAVIAGGTRRGDVTHREMLYRGAWQMGRHLLGYEVQKVFAVVDWFTRGELKSPVAVVGHGEGGRVAMFAGALDWRIDIVGISGAFDSRLDLWQEPIDRNVFGLLTEFGDAEVCSLIVPRPIIIEACAVPIVEIAPGTASAPGRIETPPLDRVTSEFQRLVSITEAVTPRPTLELLVSDSGNGPAGSARFVDALLTLLRAPANASVDQPALEPRPPARVEARRQRQFEEILAFNERLIDESASARARYFERLDAARSRADYETLLSNYRHELHARVLGILPDSLVEPRARSRLRIETPAFRGYDVVIDVVPDVTLYGILLVPVDVRSGQKRSVVVCQHGLEGRAEHTIEGDKTSYRDFAARLARLGFVTFSPQHLYQGGDAFRVLQRKANPLGLTLFSFMVAQHEQLLRWLATLEFVDPARVGFYGISYGGKSAMRIPAVLAGYALSICSSDYSDWIWRTVSSRHGRGYLAHSEYEIFEFNLGNTFNYAELTALICPRPFMVESFHKNDEFSARTRAEFAKGQARYDSLGLGERIAITYYENYLPQTEYVHRETFDFLQRHLGDRPE